MSRQKKHVSFRKHIGIYPAIIILIPTLVACDHSSGQPTKGAPTTTAPKIDESAKYKVPNDESLTAEEYIRLGLAAHDREWSSEDMMKAEKILSGIAQNNGRQLPRYKSERSGAVFARMTSPQNLNLFRNRSLPLDMRFPLARDYVEASNKIPKLYMAAFLKKDIGASELVELAGLQFQTCLVGLELIDEFLPTLKKDDPSYQVRLQGLEKMKRGLAGVVIGGLMIVTDRASCCRDDLARLISYMQGAYPLIVPRLLPASRMEILNRLEKLPEEPAMKDLKPELRELYTKVKTAADKESAAK